MESRERPRGVSRARLRIRKTPRRACARCTAASAVWPMRAYRLMAARSWRRVLAAGAAFLDLGASLGGPASALGRFFDEAASAGIVLEWVEGREIDQKGLGGPREPTATLRLLLLCLESSILSGSKRPANAPS